MDHDVSRRGLSFGSLSLLTVTEPFHSSHRWIDEDPALCLARVRPIIEIREHGAKRDCWGRRRRWGRSGIASRRASSGMRWHLAEQGGTIRLRGRDDEMKGRGSLLQRGRASGSFPAATQVTISRRGHTRCPTGRPVSPACLRCAPLPQRNDAPVRARSTPSRTDAHRSKSGTGCWCCRFPESLLSNTGTNLATRVANGGFCVPAVGILRSRSAASS